MKKIVVNSLSDLYALKKIRNSCDEIEIDLTKLNKKGLVRHAVKYAMYALKQDGKILINTNPFKTYYFRKNAIDFWQVKYEVFNSLKDTVELVELDAAKGKLILRKTKDIYQYNGVSFGIVFSGNESEVPQLEKAIESILQSKSISLFEILVSGPTNYDAATLTLKYPKAHLKYLPINISTSPRLMICEKKNFLFDNARYNIVAISHTRILYSKDFQQKLLQSIVEMATPAVYFVADEKEYKYLDIGFMDSYQDIQFGAKRGIIAGENITSDYLHWYRKRVPYVDGGLNIFNKNIIEYPPYNNYIAWGEAEDVDVCNRLFQNGILIDYLPEIKCYSSTNKLKGYNILKTLSRKIIQVSNKMKS